MSTSQALTRKVDMELMPPPPPPKRIKRPPKVLDEETYTDALSEIIARDFFPGLLETQHQQEYLNALDSQDPSWIADASRRLTEVMTTPRLRRRGTSFAASTPRYRDVFATPVATPTATPRDVKSNPMAPAEDEQRNPTYEKHLSLDSFQAKYTSEDNASFNDLLDKQNEKKRNAYAFLWSGNRIPGFRAKAEQKRLKERAEKEEKEGPTKSISWVDDRKAVPNTWKAEPRNTLMFAPDGSPPPQAPPKEGAKELPPKSVVYANTRMPPLALPGPPPSPSFSTVRDAIAGNPRLLPSESGFGGAETPRVNGYSFVADAPSPSPSELGAPPLTWGSIAAISSTSDAGSSSAGTPAPFKLAPTPRRELLHHRMVDRVAKNKRTSKPLLSAPGGAATPKMTPLGGNGKGREIPRFQSTPVTLTPAGQRLWSNLTNSGQGGGIFGGMAGAPSGSGGGERMRWMPTPRAGGGATPRASGGKK